MSAAYFVARGELPVEAENAEPAWACSGCMACRERCDHKNDVATVLFDARAEMHARGASPPASVQAALKHEARSARSARRAQELSAKLGASPQSATRVTGVLVGCGYHRASEAHGDPEEAPIDELAARSVAKLLDRDARDLDVIDACCGLPLLHAGDREGFVRAAERFARRVSRLDSLVAVDPGCARAVSFFYPKVGVEARAPKLFVDLANENVDRLRRVVDEPPRYHDPCQLGRGLGRYDEPRRVLTKIAGAPPREFQRHGRMGECSGAGGLLPAVMPKESDLIARARIDEHKGAGGGTLVTACAASLRRFRASGERAVDLITFVARSLGIV